MSIYQCIQPDERYTPPQMKVVHHADSERAALDWLEANGGGIYRNTLHNFDCKIKSKGEKE
jgi:hypothetical protein